MKALIIEDSPEVVDAISLALQMHWTVVSVASSATGNTGVEMLKSEPFDVVILDINLPDTSGFDVLGSIRSFSDVPVIIVTVRGKKEDKARGLELGAADYIVKPFSPRDLVARINAALRRAGTPWDTTDDVYITYGKLSLNLATDEVLFGNQKLKLTPTESKLLYVLMKNAEHTLTSQRITQLVWGKEDMETEPLRTYIGKLRNKLDDNPPQIILTEHGEGYRFVSPS